jgi:hypothetical protein
MEGDIHEMVRSFWMMPDDRGPFIEKEVDGVYL